MSTIIIITPKKRNAAAEFAAEDADFQAPSDFDRKVQFDGVAPDVVREVVDLLFKHFDNPGCSGGTE